jgi:hypothetical protein
MGETLSTRVFGRILLKDIKDAETGEVKIGEQK